MTKKEFISRIAEKSGIIKVKAGDVYNAMAEVIQLGVSHDGMVQLPGIGSFKKVHKPERTSRNPRTGEPITTPAHNAVKFKAYFEV